MPLPYDFLYKTDFGFVVGISNSGLCFLYSDISFSDLITIISLLSLHNVLNPHRHDAGLLSMLGKIK